MVLKNLHFFENCNSDSLMVGGQLEREGVVKGVKKKFNIISGDRGEIIKVQGKKA